MKRIIIALLLGSILLGLLVSCRKNGAAAYEPTPEEFTFTETDEPTNYVKLEMEDGSLILMELFPQNAPITVQNFKKLVAEHFYDGVTFHRVIQGFMIQGGDPDGDGYGGSSETIKGEFSANGVDNPLKHTRGVLSMARTGQSYNSATSQFFIMHQDAPHLDGQYAAFGKVIAGMATVDKIASVKTSYNNRPLHTQTMKSIRFIVIEGIESGEAK